MEIFWKGTVSAEFRTNRPNRPKLCRNCAFPQNFHTRELGEITVFSVVCQTENKLVIANTPLFDLIHFGHYWGEKILARKSPGVRHNETHHNETSLETSNNRLVRFKPAMSNDVNQWTIVSKKLLSLYMLVFSSITWLWLASLPHQFVLAGPAEGFSSFKKLFLAWFYINNMTLILRRKLTLFHPVKKRGRWTEIHQMRLCWITQKKKKE